MKKWQKLWRIITSPVATIDSKYERERIALYSALMLILTCVFVLLTIFLIFIQVRETIFQVVFIVVALTYAGLYALSRTAYYRWSGRFYIWLTIGIIIYSFLYLAPANSRYVLSFIAVPTIIAGFLLSRRETILNIAIAFFLVVFVEVAHPDYDFILTGTPLLIAIVGFLTLLATAITERYYEQAVDNEARYRSLMQANFEGIVVIEKDTARILDVNPAVERMLGYSASELLDRKPLEFVSSEDKLAVQTTWKNGVQESTQEVRMRHKQGYTVYIEATMRPYSFLNQPAFVLTLLDISDRKQVETLMIESEKRFRAIFNESNQMFSILDTSGRLLEFNQSVYDKFGFQPNEVLGRYLWDFDNWAHTEELKTRTKKLVHNVLKGHTIQDDMVAIDKDGNQIYLDFSMKAITGADNTPRMLIIESRDKTAYHLADAKRTEYEQRYQAVFDHTTDAVFIFDMQGQFISINQRAEEMLQIKAKDIKHYQILDFVVPEEHKQSSETIKHLMNGGEVSHIPERKMKRADGEVFYAETLGMIVKDTQGNPRYIQSMVRDISERKRLEKARFDSALQRERTQLLAHFIDNASHYFRTPITNMKTRLYLLPRVIDRPEKRDEQIEVLNTELERLQNLLDDLLSVLRLQKDDTEYSLSKVPVRQLLIEVQQSFAGRSQYQEFQWTWQSDDYEATVIGDKGRLSKAIFNLVENAIAYTPVGKEIIIRSFVQQDYVAIDVINSGEGIKEDDLPFIFDDFYRGQEAMEKNNTSTGLGLTIAKMIVERHQGVIYVTNPVTGGAHFQILLPLHTDWKTSAPPLPDTILFPEVVS